jgi:anti-sigma regulatory factor (Ser/Thr protein kinase)
MPYHRCADCGLISYSPPSRVRAPICPTCSAVLGDDTRLYLAPGASHTVRRALPARAGAVGEARREVIGLPIPRTARDQIALVVSELVTNAVRHTGASDIPLRLQIRLRSGRARIEVRDGGAGFDAPSTEPDPLQVGGQGLMIVAALSERWGVTRGADGCTVWCEVLIEDEPPSTSGREARDTYARATAPGP